MNKIIVITKKIIFGSLSIILFLAFWEIASRTGLVTSVVIPPPTLILLAMIKSAGSGELFTHMWVSLGRAGLGYLLALVVGIPTGFLLGTFFKTFEKALLPFLRMLEKLNPFALFPIFMIIFGIGNLEKVAVIFWVAQWPLIFNTISGTKGIDPNMISRTFHGREQKSAFLQGNIAATVPNILPHKIVADLIFYAECTQNGRSTQGHGWFIFLPNYAFQIP